MTPRHSTPTDRAALDEALAGTLATSLPEFLPRQRWFGSKARAIRDARVVDHAWLPDTADPGALVVAEVRFAEGEPERYALVLAVTTVPGDRPVVGRAGEDGPWIVEAALDPAYGRALLTGFVTPGAAPTAAGGTLRCGDLPPGRARVFEAAELAGLAIRPLGAEQSNTSLVAGTSHIFKLFRRLEAGESPELEVGRHLTRHTRFRSFPALWGSLVLEPAGGGPNFTLGVLQQRIDNHGDGWSHALSSLGAIARGERGPDGFVEDMLHLGRTTAGLHLALATPTGDPAFAPVAAGDEDVAGWRRAQTASAGRALAALARAAPHLPEDARSLAGSVLAARARLEAGLPAPRPVGDAAFQRIRVHGDYHLGQTLKVADGYVILDFEGEPARPLAKRRQPHAALKDVAGMLRSLDYAVEAAGVGAAPPLREAFLEGYRAGVGPDGPPGFLPRDPAAFDAWRAFFELDKVLYELEYELNHRPDWVRLPLAGIVRLTGHAWDEA